MARARTLLFAALLPTLSGVAWAQGFHPGDAVRVNGVAISNQRFNGFYVEYRNAKGVAVGARGDQLELLVQLRREAMALIIEQELLRQVAQGKGIKVRPDEVDAAVSELRTMFDEQRAFVLKLKGEGFTEQSYREHVKGMLAARAYLDGIRATSSTVSDAELEAYYHENEHRLTFPERVRVRHILLTWKSLGTDDDRSAVHGQMAPLLALARSGEDFAALALEHSQDYETKRRGGDTGFFHRGQKPPAFEAAAFALKPGEISDMVETPFGVHILRLEERREPYLLPLDEIREKLRAYVREEKAEEAVRREIERLRTAADVEILIPLTKRESYR
jgi:peptidyl-prolyl cis-trans isomerase C